VLCEQVHKVVLVGGSTRIPKVQSLVSTVVYVSERVRARMQACASISSFLKLVQIYLPCVNASYLHPDVLILLQDDRVYMHQ
jgi:hypothetical protein